MIRLINWIPTLPPFSILEYFYIMPDPFQSCSSNPVLMHLKIINTNFQRALNLITLSQRANGIPFTRSRISTSLSNFHIHIITRNLPSNLLQLSNQLSCLSRSAIFFLLRSHTHYTISVARMFLIQIHAERQLK